MKRRDFVLRSAAVALLGAVPLGAMAASRRGTLLENPTAWLGSSFRLDNGNRLELVNVESVAGDGQSTQYRLQFRTRSGFMPPEGTHRLDCGWCEEYLFLQPGLEGPVACVNRLAPRKI